MVVSCIEIKCMFWMLSDACQRRTARWYLHPRADHKFLGNDLLQAAAGCEIDPYESLMHHSVVVELYVNQAILIGVGDAPVEVLVEPVGHSRDRSEFAWPEKNLSAVTEDRTFSGSHERHQRLQRLKARGGCIEFRQASHCRVGVSLQKEARFDDGI